jgi:hypothetical protein
MLTMIQPQIDELDARIAELTEFIDGTAGQQLVTVAWARLVGVKWRLKVQRAKLAAELERFERDAAPTEPLYDETIFEPIEGQPEGWEIEAESRFGIVLANGNGLMAVL